MVRRATGDRRTVNAAAASRAGLDFSVVMGQPR
jgi:hypothetical protein